MFGFTKKSASSNCADLGWDLHAHLLPSVDDGVRSVDEALEAISELSALGYAGCIVTPHIYRDLYQQNDSARLKVAFDALRSELINRDIPFQLQLAAEYFADGHLIELASADDLLWFGPADAKFVLMEFPCVGEPLFWADTLSAVTAAGYTPVIAHPERYRYVAADYDGWLERFAAYPVKYQCDLGSLVGQYGPEPAKIAKRLLNDEMPTFWGTDLHRPSQAARFIRPALDRLRRSSRVNDGLA